MIEVVILGRPVAKQRPRTRNGRTYTPSRTRSYEQLVATYASAAHKHFSASDDLAVSIRLVTKRKLRGDLDNYAKAILDGLVKGQLIPDDDQISYLEIERVSAASLSDHARVRVERR